MDRKGGREGSRRPFGVDAGPPPFQQVGSRVWRRNAELGEELSPSSESQVLLPGRRSLAVLPWNRHDYQPVFLCRQTYR